MLASLSWLLVPAVGCASRNDNYDESGETESVASSVTRRQLSDMTGEFIDSLDNALTTYRALLSTHGVSEAEIAAARNRVRTLAAGFKQAMVDALQRGNRMQRRVSAAALGFVPGPAEAANLVPALLDAIPNRARQPVPRNDEALGITFYALIGLAEMGRAGSLYVYPNRDEVLAPIAALVRDDMTAIRAVAIEAFGHALSPQDEPEWIDTLTLRLAEEKDADVRKLIVDALANIGDHRGYQAILSFALQDGNATVREDSVVALGKSLNRAYIEPITGMLNDPVPAVRMQAIGMLKGFRRFPERVPELVDAISRMLYDRDSNVRERAILALGELGDTSVVPDLISTLADRRESVRLASIIALGRLRDERGIPPLIQVLTAKEDNIRNAARRSLVLITAVDLGADASAWQQWDESGRPPVTGRHDPRFATGWGDIEGIEEAGDDGLSSAEPADDTPATDADGVEG